MSEVPLQRVECDPLQKQIKAKSRILSTKSYFESFQTPVRKGVSGQNLKHVPGLVDVSVLYRSKPVGQSVLYRSNPVGQSHTVHRSSPLRIPATYMGTALIRKRLPVGPYNRPMPMVLRWS